MLLKKSSKVVEKNQKKVYQKSRRETSSLQENEYGTIKKTERSKNEYRNCQSGKSPLLDTLT
jgi:hypothetical protein